MMSTRQAIALLRAANPGRESEINENRVRAVLRSEAIVSPGLFAGRLAWRPCDIRILAIVLQVDAPASVLPSKVSTR